jgi:hypothetical protein
VEATNTPPNRALAQAVNSRINADAVMLRAKSTLWRLTGVGTMLALIGVGVGAALFGYSYVHDPRSSAEKMATAFAEALEKTSLKTTGGVRLDPTAQVALKNGAVVDIVPTARVKLDANDVVVKLDPNSKINAGTQTAPQPTDGQLKPNAFPPSNAKVVTNYTVFKSVAYETGFVTTGWTFTSSEESAPNVEYCYYSKTVEANIGFRLNLATNGTMLPQIKADRGFEAAKAASNCVWFSGGTTRVAGSQS